MQNYIESKFSQVLQQNSVENKCFDNTHDMLMEERVGPFLQMITVDSQLLFLFSLTSALYNSLSLFNSSFQGYWTGLIKVTGI